MSAFTTTDPHIEKLVTLSTELKDLATVNALLAWDQETYLPAEGALARARQMEVLSGILHERSTRKELAETLERVEEAIQKDPAAFTIYDKALLKEMKRDYTMATKLPMALVQALSKESSIGLESWKHARIQSDYSIYEPHLRAMIALKQQVAEKYGYQDSPYDALLDEYEEGLTKKQTLGVFDQLKKDLVPLIPELVKKTASYNRGILSQTFDEKALWDFSLHVLTLMGFDSARGRQDQSTHPFTMGLSSGDVRLTTRVIANQPLSTLLSSIHEGGHGLYEQGVDTAITHTTLGYNNSLVIHESQSRFWENMIGRSKPFWDFLFPQMQAVFPTQLGNVSASDVWKEANAITPSLIRVDADEVTYHLHIMIRSELECALIEGTLDPKDAEEAWNAAYKKYLGVDVPDAAHGILQDIHWSQGLIGYFPTYSMGTMLAAQLFATLKRDKPTIEEDIRAGKFEIPLKWLNHEIHQFARIYSSNEVATRITGSRVTADALVAHIKDKFAL